MMHVRNMNNVVPSAYKFYVGSGSTEYTYSDKAIQINTAYRNTLLNTSP